MAKFAANLTLLFTEVPFLERFEKAHQAGFKAVEYLAFCSPNRSGITLLTFQRT